MFGRGNLCKQEGYFCIFLTLSIFFLSIHRLYLILKIFGAFFCKLITFKWYLNASGSDTEISLHQNNSCLQKMPMYLFSFTHRRFKLVRKLSTKAKTLIMIQKFLVEVIGNLDGDNIYKKFLN